MSDIVSYTHILTVFLCPTLQPALSIFAEVIEYSCIGCCLSNRLAVYLAAGYHVFVQNFAQIRQMAEYITNMALVRLIGF